MDAEHTFIFTLAALALQWAVRPENWPAFSGSVGPTAASLTRDQAQDFASHFSRDVLGTGDRLIMEAN